MQKSGEPETEEPTAEASPCKTTLSPEDAKKFKDAAKQESGSVDDTLPSDLEQPE